MIRQLAEINTHITAGLAELNDIKNLWRAGLEIGKQKVPENNSGTSVSSIDVLATMVNLTTKQVETFFGELEYIEPRLKTLELYRLR